MKFTAACLAVSLSAVSAFAPSGNLSFRTQQQQWRLPAATSFEEDLALTLKVILDHENRSTTASKEQFLSQMKEAEMVEESGAAAEPIDVSIPYNAAAVLAYEAAGKPGDDFASFEAKYIEETVAMVAAKKAERDGATVPEPKEKAAAKPAVAQPVDLSIPYDAAAKLAYEASDKKLSYDEFKSQYEANAVAEVVAKRNDIAVVYDSAAINAYMASNRKMPFALFKEQYFADARSAVMAKQSLSVNYDSAALLEYGKSDRSMSWEDFKAKYEADAIAQVIAKKEAREA